MRIYHLMFVAFVVLVVGQPALAGPFNVNDAFLANEVPNGSETLTFAGPHGGTISLGYNETPSTPGTFATTSLVHTDAFNGSASVEGWHVANSAIVPALLFNTNGGVNDTNFGTTMSADQILLHPGNPGDNSFLQPASAAVLRYTVATTGLYDVTGSFDSIASSNGIVAVDVLFNGASILSAGAGSDATSFSELGVSMTAGDFLDFVVDDEGAINSDSTGLFANVALTIPEPSTFLLAALGLLGLLGFVRRKRQQAA